MVDMTLNTSNQPALTSYTMIYLQFGKDNFGSIMLTILFLKTLHSTFVLIHMYVCWSNIPPGLETWNEETMLILKGSTAGLNFFSLTSYFTKAKGPNLLDSLTIADGKLCSEWRDSYISRGY